MKKRLDKLIKNRSLVIISFIAIAFLLGVNVNLLSKVFPNITASIILPQEKLSPKQFKDRLDNKDFLLINVHTPYEGEIAGTDLFIDYDSFVANRSLLPENKNTPIVLYCRSGRMSAEALRTLKSIGYANVSHLDGGMLAWEKAGYKVLDLANLSEQVLPNDGFELPISWGKLGPRLIGLGVIDYPKFEKAVELSDEQKTILTKGTDEKIKIDSQNSQFVVDFLWALGLAQESNVYKEGPLGKEYKAQAGNVASTGGWTLARGNAVSYLGKYNLINLTSDQQQKVSEIAKNVYRPCCGNSTWFPDCNHGMAALAAIELMVSQNMGEDGIYNNLLKLNSFWFPQNYLTTATYFARKGTFWNNVNAKDVLGQEYSSAMGAQNIAKEVGPLPYGGGVGGTCGA